MKFPKKFSPQFIFLCLFISNTLFSTNELSSIFDQLYRDDILQITLETDLKLLIKNKYSEEYQDAWLTYQNPDGVEVKRKVTIRARGNMRKKVCYYPPFKIKFPKEELEKEGLNPEFDDIKVVSGCRKGETSDQYVLKEHLVYKFYNEFTDKSFRTQLCLINYIDTSKRGKPFKSYAFLIESEEQLAERFGGKITEPSLMHSKYVLPEMLDLISVFQFMVGNTDWAIGNMHNIKLVRSPDYSLAFPVPYDFDYAGLVNTHYAIPTEGLPIKTVRERYFKGLCRESGTYESIIEVFIAKKEAVYKVCEGMEMMDKKDQKDVLFYIDSFYEIIENPKLAQRMMIDLCREL